MRKEILLGLLLLLSSSILLAQDYNLGVPIIQAFPKEITEAGSQNSDIVQDKFGVMYFANNSGMLQFDGTTWTVFPLPNFTIVRSLGITDNGIIYAGGQNEFGRYIPNEKGIWEFESLKHLIPKLHQNFEDVWEIEVQNEEIFFRASNKLYHFHENHFNVYTKGDIVNIGQVNGKIYAQDIFTGIYFLENNKFKLIEGSEFFQFKGVEGIVPFKQGYLIACQEAGFFTLEKGKIVPWKTYVDDFIKENRIHDIVPILGNRLAIATAYGGIIILDEEGKSISHIHKGNGLLNNNFLSLCCDKNNNLWIGLSNGINYIQINSPFTRIYPDKDKDAVGFDIKIFKDKIYFATNKGLYQRDWKPYYSPDATNDFDLIENTKGQVWGIDIIDDDLLIGHNNGAYIIENDKAKRFFKTTGMWTFDELEGYDDKVIAGSYNNIVLFDKVENQWKTKPLFTNLGESCRFMEQDMKGNIWMSHPYRGIYKITPNESLGFAEVKKYGPQDGLPSANLNHLFRIKDDIIFCGERGVFNFNYESERFEPYDAFNSVFGKNTKVRRLQETPNGDIWFITNTELGILKISDKGLEKKIKKIVFPFLNKQLNGGFETIYPFTNDNVFITNDRGFIHYHPTSSIQADTSFQVVFNNISITSKGDSLISNGFYFEENQVLSQQPETQIKSFTHDLNNWFFSFSGTDFASGKATQYRYYLEGFESDWADWNFNNFKEYTNLSPGEYTFHLQAKSNSQILSNEITYSFAISPPWYQSKLAYLLYLLLGVWLLGYVIRFYQKKYSGLKEDHIQVIKESEAAIGKLKEEKEESELAFKQRELTSATLNLVKKNETLVNIKTRLGEIKKNVKDPDSNKAIQKLIQKLQAEEIQDENWEQMMLHFNQVHSGYFEKLKETYPELTPKDLKMCAYLRMNLTTKEMTSLLNVTTRGVEASRYRLRKKFSLRKEQNLTEFLMQFK